MKSDLALQVEERFNWYRKLVEEGAWYSAATRLAEISHCLPLLRKDQQAMWSKQILDVELSEKDLAEVQAGISRDADRIRRVLSVGDEWNAEEVLLILQTRIEIELLLDFLNKWFSIEPSVSLQDIDHDIEALAKRDLHSRHFRWSIRKMKQNWGLPIHSKWLSGEIEA